MSQNVEFVVGGLEMRNRVPVQLRSMRGTEALGKPIPGFSTKYKCYSSDGNLFWQLGAKENH